MGCIESHTLVAKLEKILGREPHAVTPTQVQSDEYALQHIGHPSCGRSYEPF